MLTLSLFAVLACAFLVSLRRQWRGTSLRHPPGPWAIPAIGNLLHFPLSKDSPWRKLLKWKYEFGKMTYLHGFGNSVVVLNDIDTCNDLLVKDGHVWTDRPVFTMGGELMGVDRSTVFMSNTPTWRYHRKLTDIAFNANVVKEYCGAQEDIAALMAQSITTHPEGFIEHLRLATGRIIMSVTYGISPQLAEEDYIRHAEDTLMLLTETLVPGAYLVDAIPSLKYLPEHLPFKTFHDKAREGRAMSEKLVFPPYHQVKKEMAAGEAPHSLVKQLLSLPHADTQSDSADAAFEDAVIWAAGSMYGAGVETTYSTVLNCILAMTMYPEVQRRAQLELDSVVGDKLPSIENQHETPYLNALLQELLRWHPALPLGIPHRSSKDVVYQGFFLPKNTIAIANVWAITREEDPDFSPEEFAPERFLPRPSGFVPQDPFTYAFGFGRRICPGKALAANSIYILVAYLVHNFSYHLPRNVDGVEEAIHPTWRSSLTSFPNPFKCRIVPRSEERMSMINQRASSARMAK
ncbi:Cytochrome P450 [Mycena indigotica]|uniref:Cytochrome P450 n=1 Tax=Mycena indigotica TaxID=2126181 RepID=A0A8H6S778_9AGAR|nr:Cytochrome P450 [Mycena indigotica]KAF7293082.1 Cytochrome P450 [Mycena indigotica]